MKRLILITSILITLIFVGLTVNTTTKKTSKEINNESTNIIPKINKDSLLKLGYPKRIIDQYNSVRINSKYNGKSFFIVDTKENLIFFFDKNGKFVAKSPTIDGFDKQTSDKIKISNTLKSWTQTLGDMGFEWNKRKGTYIDTTNQNRVYTPRLVYNYLGEKKIRFFPKGIYIIPDKYHSEDFLGSMDNTYNVETIDGGETAIAIHGLYKSQYRIKNMNKLLKTIGSDFNKTFVSKEYQMLISENDNNSTFNNSFGCINVPEGFLKLTNQNVIGSLIFVLGENDNNFLVR